MAYFLGKDITGAEGLSAMPMARPIDGEDRPAPDPTCVPGKSCTVDTQCVDGTCDGVIKIGSLTKPGKCNCGGTIGPKPKPCVPGGPCTAPADCGGKLCVGYDPVKKRMGNCDCTKAPPPPAVCVEGATCKDGSQCQPGGSCINGKCYCKSGSCKDDATCVRLHSAGWTCVKTAGSPTGICKPPATGNCVPGKKCTGPKRPNSQCGGLTCFRPKSWDGKDETVPGTCYCKEGDGDGDGTLGEYKYPSDPYKHMDEYGYPDEMQELMNLLLGRGKELLGMPTGYTQEAIEKMYGRDFEKIRGQEAGQRETLMNTLARSGMTGTGAGNQMLNQLAWGTEGNISDLARDLFIANEEKKKQDLLDYTNAAQGIMGGGALSYESLLEDINKGRRGETYNIENLQEAINAARRGESSQALMLLIQFLGLLGG